MSFIIWFSIKNEQFKILLIIHSAFYKNNGMMKRTKENLLERAYKDDDTLPKSF